MDRYIITMEREVFKVTTSLADASDVVEALMRRGCTDVIAVPENDGDSWILGIVKDQHGREYKSLSNAEALADLHGRNDLCFFGSSAFCDPQVYDYPAIREDVIKEGSFSLDSLAKQYENFAEKGDLSQAEYVIAEFAFWRRTWKELFAAIPDHLHDLLIEQCSALYSAEIEKIAPYYEKARDLESMHPWCMPWAYDLDEEIGSVEDYARFCADNIDTCGGHEDQPDWTGC